MKTTHIFKIITYFGVACVSLLATRTACAATYYVATTGNDANAGTQAAPFKTIQRGIDTAVNGDTVLVGNGTYTDTGNTNLTFKGKNITLRSRGGSANCTIDCQADQYRPARAILFTGGETNSAILDGFTLTNGFDSVQGGAMYISGASPTIRNCVFYYNAVNGQDDSSSFAGQGGALSIRDNSSPVISRCTFSTNIAVDTAGGLGGAIYIQCTGTATLSDCLITNNHALGLYNAGNGGGMCVLGGTVRLINCIVAANQAEGDQRSKGGGAYVASSGNLIATNCTFTRNSVVPATSQTTGGAVVVEDGTTSSGTATLTNCIFYGNSSPGDNLEISINGGASAVVTFCDVKGGFAGQGNIDSDPLFVDAAAGNYQLQTSSPCIDTGTGAAPNLPAYDITGNITRNLGGKVDMGVYEYIQPNAFFVDGIAGNDTNSGTPAAPFRTVARALTAATDPNKVYTLYTAAANYSSDRLRITKSVRFLFWRNTGAARIGAP